MVLRLAILCSNHLFSEGLQTLLKDEREIDVLCVTQRGNSFLSDLNDCLQMSPDVILADFSPDFHDIFSLPEGTLNENQVKIILLGERASSHIADKKLRELVIRGVVGILPPSADSELLKKALKAVHNGELWLDRTTLMKLLSSMKQQEKRIGLAKREKEIVLHICQGYRNREIAEKLQISEQTVKSHCNRIYKKLGVSDRLQLALYYHNIIDSN